MLELTVNQDIAEHFLVDSRDFLERYKLLGERSLARDASIRYKLLTELLFAAECAIKGLIFFDSTDDTDVIYNKVMTHDLNKLLQMLSSKEYDICIKYIDSELLHCPIDVRYGIEAYKARSSSCDAENKYYDTIANCDWHKSAYEHLSKLVEYAATKRPNKDIHLISFADMSSEDINAMFENDKKKVSLKKHKKSPKTT
jgi:hypothetical protein